MASPRYSKEDKERFFDLLDRGGTVRAAADAAGVHPAAAYSWVRKAGLTMRRAS
jgi:transposase-like protein